MKSPDVRFAEAVTELSSRLEQQGVEDAAALATDLLRWLIHEGWRPNARPIESGPIRSSHTVTPEQHVAYAERARQLLREQRAATEGEVTP